MILKITLSFENDKQTKYQWSIKVPSIQGKHDTSYILFAEGGATIIEKSIYGAVINVWELLCIISLLFTVMVKSACQEGIASDASEFI